MVKIFDSWDSSYKSKFGALKCGEPCRFSVRLPKEIKNDLPPIMVIFRVGFKERFLIMEEASSNDEYTVYSVEYTPTSAGIHYYYFTVVCSEKRGFIKRKGCNEGVFGDGGMFQLTVYDKDFATPSFLKGGIMYQIFPDRFCKSGKPHDNVPFDRIIHEDWYELPRYKPDESGTIRNNDYFGGDFEGIIQKLDYLKSLGVTAIYLNPIFEAHSNHRYNTADYSKIDPLLGDENDFIDLCKQAERAGISIIIDGVFSHTGSDSIYFNKNKRYGESTGAYNDPNSPYFRWYSFESYPEKYQCWWGFETLPNTNENDSSFSEYICGENGIINKWIKLGAKGIRLDVADELPDEMLDKIRTAVKRADKNAVIIGEVWEDASNKQSYGVRRRYLLGSQLDSVMNYPFKNAILSYIKDGNGEAFLDSILTVLENYPKPVVDILMNSLSTHDTERAITILGGEPVGSNGREWQAEHHCLNSEQYRTGKHRLMLAAAIQFFLPGVPCIYYGDEAGMYGYKDPFNRCCYPWGSEDTSIIEFIRFIANIRKNNSYLSSAEFMPVTFSDTVCSFVRKTEKQQLFVAVNRDISYHELVIPPDFKDKQPLCVLGELEGDRLSPMSAIIISA